MQGGSTQAQLEFPTFKESCVLFPISSLPKATHRVVIFKNSESLQVFIILSAGQEQQDLGGNIRNIPALSAFKKSFEVSYPRSVFYSFPLKKYGKSYYVSIAKGSLLKTTKRVSCAPFFHW